MINYEPYKGVIFFVFFLFSALGYGIFVINILLRFFTKDNNKPSNLWYLYFPISFGLIPLLLFFLGILGLIYPITAWILLIVGWLLIVLEKANFNILISLKHIRKRLLNISILDGLLLLVILGNLSYCIFSNVLIPPVSWDEIAYHLALPKIFINNHQLIEVPFIFQSYWPSSVEMLFMQGLLLGTDIFSHLVIWFMGVWSIIGIAKLGNIFVKNSGLWAATIFSGLPIVIRFLGTGLIDIALVFWSVVGIISFIKYYELRSIFWLVLSGVFFGFSANVKFTGLISVIYFCLIIIVIGLKEKSYSKLLKEMGLFVATVILVISPWYIRSYYLTGNPVYPFYFTLFGGKNWDIVGDMNNNILWASFSENIPISFSGFIESIRLFLFKPGLLGGYNEGLGFIVPVMAMIGIIVNLFATNLEKKNHFKTLILVGFGIVYYLVWFFMGKLDVRYLFPVIALLVILSINALNIRYIVQAKYSKVILFLFAISLFFQLPWLEELKRNDVISKIKISFTENGRREFVQKHVDVFSVFEWMDNNLDSQEVIFLLPFENRGYYLNRKYIWGHLGEQRIVRFEEYNEPAEFEVALRKLGVTYILDSTTWLKPILPNWEHDRGIMLAFYENCTELKMEWENQKLYKLNSCN